METEKQLIEHPDDIHLQTKYTQIKQQLDIFALNKARGAQVRSKQLWIEEGERNTAYFCSLEKSRSKINTITCLKNNEGEMIKDRSRLLKEQVEYYTNLYNQSTTAENIRLETDKFLENENFRKLDDNKANECEGLMTIDECFKSLSKMKNGSSPGRDGLTTEFYKCFWPKIGDLVVNSYNESFARGHLTYSQKQGVIILLHKGKGLDKNNLSNWRPITLLNSDYKILAKTLTERLSNVIQDLISTDQCGYLKGRSISTVIRTIDDVINYVNQTDRQGYILACDYMKAYDSISKNFLQYTFEIFGFKPDYRNWVKVLMNGTQSSISHSGWLSRPINITCGIRQGCNWSPLAFILAVELLAIKIRNSTITGIESPINGTQNLKIKQLADDMTLFNKNKTDMETSINLIDKFSTFSGLKLNINKTKALAIGNNQNENNLPVQTVNKIKILGIHFESNKSAIDVNDNWEGRIQKIQNDIRRWSIRDLSIHGKITVIKTFLLSQVIFIMQSVGLPKEILTKLNTLFYKFIWQRKHSNKKAFEKVKRIVMEGDYDEGGLKMVNIIELQKYFYLQWIGRLSNAKDDENWSFIPQWFLFQQLGNLNVFHINARSSEIKQIADIKSTFWKEAITTYQNSKELISVESLDNNQYLQQQIFNNSMIRYQNKVLFFKKWIEAGLIKVLDIVKVDQQRLFNLTEIQEKVNENRAIVMFQYLAVTNSVPRIWKDKIRLINANDLNLNEDSPEAVTFDQKPKFIQDYIKKKQNQTIIPNIVNLWKRKLDIDIDKKVWLTPVETTAEIRLRELQFKISHNLYPTNILLKKMKVTENINCDFCNDEIDTMEHFFFYCKQIKDIWKHIESLFIAKTGKRLTIDAKTALFGIQTGYTKSDLKFANHLILISKMCISIVKKTKSRRNIIIQFESEVKLRKITFH